MMRVAIILIGLGLVLGVAGTVPAQPDLCSDMNDDGSFDIVDFVVLRRALALGPGITTPGDRIQRCFESEPQYSLP